MSVATSADDQRETDKNLSHGVWRCIAGIVLILIGLIHASKLKYVTLDMPSMTLILIGALVLFIPIETVLPRVRSVKASPKGIEVILDKLEHEKALSSSSRTELAGLHASDIWALDSFAKKEIPVHIAVLKPGQKVAARVLVDAKLLTIVGDGQNKMLEPTPLGHDFLRVAESIL